MRIIVTLFFILIGSNLTFAQQENGSTTIFLVRHAEKAFDEGGDPDLTDAGKERAIQLSHVLSVVNFSEIYSTKFKRTMATAKPLADAKSLSIQEYNPFKLEEITQLIKTQQGKTLLFVGHSNTIPMMLNLLTDTNDYKHIDEQQYDDLFVVNISSSGEVDVQNLKYGTSSTDRTE